MIVHRNTHELPAHDQPPGEVEVVPARLQGPGGVIVEEEQTARPIEQRQPKKLGPVDRRLGAGSEGELPDGEETVTSVEADESKDFTALALQPADQELTCDLRLIELFGGLHFSLCKPLSELNRRQKGSHLGRSESGARRQFAEIEASDAGETAGICEQTVGLDNCTASPPSGADQHGQKFGIGERTGAILEQTLTRPLRRLHLANTLCHLDLHGVFPMRGRDLGTE